MQSISVLPDYDVPGQTRPFDLMDWVGAASARVRTPLRVAIAEGLPGYIQSRLRGRAIERQLAELTPVIRSAIAGRKAGYLLRVNLYAIDAGTIFTPGGQFVTAVGLGLEPLDALAEAYRSPSIRVPPPVGLRDVSLYFWLNERPGQGGRTHLIGTHIPSDLSRHLERQARQEAERRELLGAVFVTPAPDLFLRVQQSEFWAEVYRDRLVAISDEANRRNVSILNNRFLAAETRFNQAYEAYQRVERQIVAHAREMAVLDAIDVVLSLTKARLQQQADDAARRSRTADPSSAGTPPPLNNQNMSMWRETRELMLGGVKQTITTEVRGAFEDLIGAQDQLKAGWSSAGVVLPSERPINVELP